MPAPPRPWAWPLDPAPLVGQWVADPAAAVNRQRRMLAGMLLGPLLAWDVAWLLGLAWARVARWPRRG